MITDVFGLLITAVVTSSAATQEVVVQGHREPSSAEPTVTRIQLDGRTEARETISEVLRDVPGINVIESGGPGAYVGLSIRGAEFNHTAVFIGDIPLSTPDGTAPDLSLLPLGAFDGIELHRSGAPAHLGTSPIGGVLRFMPNEDLRPRLRIRAGAGSFGSGWVAARGHLQLGSWAVMAFAGGLHADNEFRFLDDGGTRFLPEDDRERPRQNAGVDDVHGMVHARWNDEHHALSLMAFALHRNQGEPGPASAPAHEAGRDRTLGLFGASHRFHTILHGRPLGIRTAITLGIDRKAFSDPRHEIGLTAQDAVDDFLGVSATTFARWGLLKWFDLNLGGGIRYDGARPKDQLSAFEGSASRRITGNIALGARFHGRMAGAAFVVEPMLRFEASETHVENADERLKHGFDVQDHRRWAARLGAKISPIRGLSLQAAVATGTRFPTVLEIFGDRATLQPNATLRPESAVHLDAGVEFARAWGAYGIDLQAHLFTSWIDDLIRYRRTSQFTAVAQNEEKARIVGGEIGATAYLGEYLDLHVAATQLHTDDTLGRNLPLRAPTQLFARLTGRAHSILPRIERLRLFVDARYRSAAFVDPANLVELSPRFHVGCGAALDFLQDRLSLAITLRDLANHAGTDLLGFPLPGRRFDLSLTFRNDL